MDKLLHLENKMHERNFVVCSNLEPTLREGSWICKRPSDQGPWVFIQLTGEPRGFHSYLTEIMSVSRNGSSRQGRAVCSLSELHQELSLLIKQAVWYRNRDGDPWAHGLMTSVGEFSACLRQDCITSTGHWSTRIVCEPAKSVPFYALKSELSRHLEIDDTAECARAYASPFAPGVTPASGKGELVAMMLARRSAS